MRTETIEKLLKDGGLEAEKVKGIVDAIMAENGKDVEKYKTRAANLEMQLKTANETLEKFKDVDVDGLKGEVQKYKEAAAKAEADGKADIEKLQFGYILDSALKSAGAKNTKAVKALLNDDGLKLNGESIVGLEEQIKAIKEDNGYLFNDEKQPTIVRTTPGATGVVGADDKNKEVNAAIRSLLGKE
ncbi:MAG: phage scaffolding protein [Clostridiales bacterium]|nr:phage scaffolding protein [Clostridiales bacterium]MDY6116979.1 phage scaffolding protein [Anaerovoracaceae bacterium]